MCCYLGEIADFKPYNQWCMYCSTQKRCDAYEARPAPCRSFRCHYLTGDLDEQWRPNRCGLVVSAHPQEKRITILVDPNQPLRWQESPHLEQIVAWSRSSAVTVMVGHRAFAVTPQRIEDLGEVAPDETILTHEEMLKSGATRFVSLRTKK
jgi:hypothetical protein